MNFFRKNFQIISLTILVLALFVFSYSAVMAGNGLQDAQSGLNQTAGKAGFEETARNIPEIVSDIVQTMLSILGIVFMILIIVSGFQWMGAGGNNEVIARARKRIINATIGLAIVLGAYLITYFIIDTLITQTGVQN